MYCPMGQRMEKTLRCKEDNRQRFCLQTISRYRAHNCNGCPLRCQCHRGRSERNCAGKPPSAENQGKGTWKAALWWRPEISQPATAGCGSRFGNLKNNKQFKRFHLRGLKKVEIEFGLLAIAHNLAKNSLLGGWTNKNSLNGKSKFVSFFFEKIQMTSIWNKTKIPSQLYFEVFLYFIETTPVEVPI